MSYFESVNLFDKYRNRIYIKGGHLPIFLAAEKGQTDAFEPILGLKNPLDSNVSRRGKQKRC